jgi:molybdate transport system regulatory protein
MPTLRLRLPVAGAMLGPGKAELLERIRETGSIAAVGRQMGIRCKRARMLVDETKAAFRTPLVARSRGGPGGGGARLTDTGRDVLHLCRAILDRAEAAAAGPIGEPGRLLKPSRPVICPTENSACLERWTGRTCPGRHIAPEEPCAACPSRCRDCHARGIARRRR